VKRRVLVPYLRPEDIVRQFRENGLKLLLHEPGNVRELLALRDPDRAARCDFTRMIVDPTSYVAADYRHLTSDLVVKVPYRARLANRWRTLTLYLLLEHQSEPDALMMLRILDYLVQIYKGQVRAWKGRPRSRGGFRFYPVLPLVLYTGESPWAALAGLTELVEGGREFADVLPQFRPLFLSLPALGPEKLETAGGYFGWVLALIQQRSVSAGEFRSLVGRAVVHLEGMSAGDRNRWLLLLSDIQALIYHDRLTNEREGLREVTADY
jgi:hypothetical protein